LGGFDPKYGYADDQTLWFKFKIKPIVARNTLCYHKNPETLKAVYRQSKWIGSSIDNLLFKLSLIKYLLLIFLVILSPVNIFILSLKKCHKNKDFKIFFPWMLIFMTVRYFGNLLGYFKKIYFKTNYR